MPNAIGFPALISRTDLRSFLTKDFSASFVAVIFFILGTFSTDFLHTISVPFLLLGFIFPGMAHGSLDLHVMNRCAGKKLNSRKLLSAYIACVLAVVLFWSISPPIVFILFLLNSAYHFGETDLRFFQKEGRLLNLIYGITILAVLFVTHLGETSDYFQSFGFDISGTSPRTLTLMGFGVTGLFVASSLLFIKNNRMLDVIIVLAVGSQLPLLLAFGIYYILVHSRTAWNDLGAELAMDDRGMLRMATPFTVAGCLLLAVVYLAFRSYSELFTDPLALTVAGLAAITLPHTISMSVFYRHFKPGRVS